MRITNKIMRNNSLYNINQNKLLEDKLSNQMTNRSKITRPSDDPVVAIRALRLRTNVTTVTQYYDKNAPDADSWIKLTGDALDTVDDVLTNLYEQATTASKKSFTADDLQIVLTQMESLTKEFYASGNVDYAGRYIFSGFRTDTPITFTAEDIQKFTKNPEHSKTYEIEENMGYEDISRINYTDWSNITDELQVTNTTLYRFRLSYNDVDETADGKYKFQIQNGAAATDVEATQFDDAETAYKAVKDGTCDVAYIPSTGEVVFGETYYQNNFNEQSKVTLTYSKTNWKEGDINPVHYFHCTGYDGKADLEDAQEAWQAAQDALTALQNDPAATQDQIQAAQNAVADAQKAAAEKQAAYKNSAIEYNADGKDQDIYYDVGFNQEIQVNTNAKEVFNHGARRDMDDFQIYLKELQDVEAKISDIEKKMEDYPEDSTEYADLQLQLEAANKAYTYIRDNVQTKFENQMTKYQNYLNEANVAITNNGTRGNRLDLISNRLMNQKATFKDLQSNNEDVDVTEVAVQLKSSELTYEASLMATSKIMQTNLMNYI